MREIPRREPDEPPIDDIDLDDLDEMARPPQPPGEPTEFLDMADLIDLTNPVDAPPHDGYPPVDLRDLPERPPSRFNRLSANLWPTPPDPTSDYELSDPLLESSLDDLDPAIEQSRYQLPEVATRPKLLSSSMLMASGTLVSRILGMVRVILAGWLFIPAAIQADIFAIATMIPSQIYVLLAGGMLNAILVPQLVRAMREDRDGGQAFTDRIATLFSLLVFGLTILLVVITPAVVWVMTKAPWRAPDRVLQYSNLQLLTALCLPQVFIFGIFFLGGQILNARGSFGPMMWAPALNNVIQVAMLAIYAVIWGFNDDKAAPFTGQQVLLLGIGSVIGVTCQTIVLIPFLKKVGFKFRPRFDFLHTGLSRVTKLAAWGLALAVIDQINLIVITRLNGSATVSGEGGAGETVFGNAILISMVPHALITVSLATALVPSLAQLWTDERLPEFAAQFASTLRIAFAAMVPFSALLIGLGIPIATLVWSVEIGGGFIGWTLMALGAGLIPLTLRFMIMKGFNSMQDTRTPFFIQAVFVAINLTLAIGFVNWLKVDDAWIAPSVAVAYSIGYMITAILSWWWIRRRLPALKTSPIFGFTAKLIAIAIPAAGVAAAICFAQMTYFPGFFPQLLGLVVGCLAGVGVYWGLAKWRGIDEITELSDWIRAKLRKERPVKPKTPSDAGRPDPVPAINEELIDPDIEADQIEAELIEAEPIEPANSSASGLYFPNDEGMEVELDDEESLTYLPGFTAEESQPVLTGLVPLVPGVLLDERYRLGRRLGGLGNGTRWLGVDETLSRPVFITAFPIDENKAAILDAARQASSAMDARFLRVLDFGEDADSAYVICEWSEARTLSELVAPGPLPSEETAWLIREVVTALASAHSMNLYHGRLDPTVIYVTASGGIKISGLCIDHCLTPRENEVNRTRTQLEAIDVAACGALLYACLTSTWPGAAEVGLLRSPRGERGPLPPLEVYPDTSQALDQLTHRILSISSQNRIGTALGVAAALTTILGPTDPTATLAARCMAMLPPGSLAILSPDPAEREETPPPAPPTDLVPSKPGRAVVAPTGPKVVSGDDDEIDIVFDDDDAFNDELTNPARSNLTMALPRKPKPARQRMSHNRALTWSRTFLVLIVVIALAVVTAVVVGMYKRAGLPSTSTPTPTLVQHRVNSAEVFDPIVDGGNAWENNELVHYAWDGDRSTLWETEVYNSSYMIPDDKDGVGLMFDLGSVVTISQITITIQKLPISVSIYRPLGEPNKDTIRNWTVITHADLASSTTDISFEPVSTRYVVVYITKLVPLPGGGRQADLAEVSFFGEA
ncbi:MAG: hypothetical protein LBE83_01000 [Propionibacteriaceae bacterium]|jgi:putative peptidoglycan lipid II flippase|nr:hypothetical protein [Propionibacteriaceae bacterium]